MATNTEAIHVDDVGTVLEVTLKEGGIAVDISAATVKKIIIERTDGTRLENDAVFSVNAGTDGVLIYVTIAGDLPIKGEYKIQAQVTLPAWAGSSSIGRFKVLENL